VRRSVSLVPVITLAVWASCAGCTGQIDALTSPGEPSDTAKPGASDDGQDPSDSDPARDPSDPASGDTFDMRQCRPPPSRVVRLSKLELQNSITDLLSTKRAIDLPDDAKFVNFSSNAEALVTPPFANALKSSAEQLAADFRASAVPAQLGSNCSASETAARACAATFVNTYGQKAFRRPLEPSERDGLLAVYDAGRETGTDGNVQDRFKAGLDYTLRALLQSPDFVYRSELGDASAGAGGVTSLTPHELASSLSYLLTASPPDAALIEAAAKGQLATAAGREREARRLLSALPQRFAAQTRRFVREWLAIDLSAPSWDKDTAIYPLYSAALKSAIDQETNLYLDDWVAQGPTLTALLTRAETFVNAVNAPLYGLTASAGSMTKVALDPAQRSGILTSPAFLGTLAHRDSSSPILRGVAVVRSVMCLTIPPPPPNVPQLPAVTDKSFTTTRDRVEKHVASASCSGCHGRINPLGYPFESYDGLGVFRTKENGYAVDASGAIVGTEASDRAVGNALELTRALAESAEVQRCFARQVFRNAFGRMETARDECALRAAIDAYQAEQLDTRELLVSLIESQTFAQRSND
jgi:hypothetical protein